MKIHELWMWYFALEKCFGRCRFESPRWEFMLSWLCALRWEIDKRLDPTLERRAKAFESKAGKV